MKSKFYQILWLVLIPLSITPLQAKTTPSFPLDAGVLQQDIAVNNKVGKVSDMNIVTLIRKGKGKNNVVQGIAVDSTKGLLYSLHVVGQPNRGVVNRFNFNSLSPAQITAQDNQSPTDIIGHQGITVDPRNGLIWASAGASITDASWKIIGFNYSPNGEPKNVRTVQLFDKNYKKSGYTMPVITPDARYLIVRSRKNKQEVMRVFDLTKVKLENGTDLSQSYLYEWSIDSDLIKNKYAFQAMTSDGKYIYLLSGGVGDQNSDNKRLYVYSIDGKLIQKLDQLTLGKYDRLSYGREGHWEPEGLAIDILHKQLLVMFAVGDKTKRLAIVYKVPINN
ncbi:MULTISPECIES: phage baseplate protein [Acinetobacter]|uniref:P68 RBP/TagC-like beta-propeller domain-containing protein n=1 Tax=Acinetobacter corruptisaponis TaxID=3045147 RepID=A0ABY8S9Q4_9GAMM|nr:hypothetical protein [Acinetobacter sp. KCTC 92772]WHP07237.1 hypothetical protein QLH32_07215 [Acinetobacter sp. KCTC 92772]